MAEAETVGELGEDRLIEIFSVSGGALGDKLLVPNGDDAAAWFIDPKHASLITSDTLVEGVHFDLAYTPPQALGRKLIAVSLSDVAAMGGRARYALLSLCLPPQMKVELAQRIAMGIREICKAQGVAVIGGNTTTIEGPIVLTSTVIGRVQPDHIVRRRGTLAGDALYVTGQLGNARAGLMLAQKGRVPERGEIYQPLFDALIDPQPRLAAGRHLAQAHLPHAMCDVSDGLGRDVRRLLVPEGLGVRLNAAQLPISNQLRSFGLAYSLSPEELAMKGGEDYELLFTADPADHQGVLDACAACGTAVSQIGMVTIEPSIEVIMPDGAIHDVPTGFEHFGGKK